MLFYENPLRKQIPLSDDALLKVCDQAAERYHELPLFHRGESKEIRRTPAEGLLIQKLIPSFSSITLKRKGMVPESDRLRMEISSLFIQLLHVQGIPTCYIARTREFMLITEEKVPAVEVIVKGAMVGTPSRIYHGLFSLTDRYGKPFVENAKHAPYVRFDYRNPLQDAKGEFLRDECMPPALADRLIDTERAEENALKIFDMIRQILNRIELQLLDFCLLFDESGRVLCCEISPDNMRIKDMAWDENPEVAGDFDKDLWRKGAEEAVILSRWELLKKRLEAYYEIS